MNYDAATAVRKYIVDQLSGVIDNHPSGQPYEEVKEAAYRAVLDLPGSGWYDYSYHHQGGVGKDRYADAVGSAVSDVVSEWISPGINNGDLLSLILGDVLDLSDSAQQYLLGLHYLPTPADMREWAEENGEDEWLTREDDN